MTTVIFSVVLLLVMGAVFGAILAFAAKVFAVEKDPKEEAILGCLPGANCGGCGFPGCAGYAAAVASGKAGVNNCAAGGEAVAAQIAPTRPSTTTWASRTAWPPPGWPAAVPCPVTSAAWASAPARRSAPSTPST